jgi:uncharacterized repeat protein (TIGR03803 family)
MKAKRNLIQFFLLFAVFLQTVTSGAQTVQTLVSFNGNNGANPSASLTLGNDGNFYGTTIGGGITNSLCLSGMGTVFKVTTNGILTTLVALNFTNGANPVAALTLGNDGNFYGTTQNGGNTNSQFQTGLGTIFKVTTNGTLTTLVSFNGNNGALPNALTLGTDGNYYGTTVSGGSCNYGTVFKVTTNGTLTTLFSFGLQIGIGIAITNGVFPEASLTLGNDGNFYGTTYYGGMPTYDSPVYGTIFRVTPNGTMTRLYSFTGGSDGGNPSACLKLGSDGNLYGTTGCSIFVYGSVDGTVFRMTTNGTLTTLVTFNGTNGTDPNALTLATDGNFYGTTSSGGDSSYGTVFQVTTNGSLTTLLSFNGNNGAGPNALTLGTAGNFYGTTSSGGNSGYGTVFQNSFAPSIHVQPSSQTNYAGSTAIFTVSVNELPSLNPLNNYQWQKNGTNLFNGGNISGANTNTLTITDVSDSDAAIYSIIFSNSMGSVTNSNVTLTVNDLPIIATQPLSQTIGVGSNMTFSATAYGASPLVFQWYFGNSPVGSPTTGTNISSYTLTNVQTNQSGNYSVQVFNGYDSATSSNAVLTVIVFAPNLTTQPTNQTVLLGRSATFTVSANGSAPFQYQWRFNSTNIPSATNSIYTIPAVVATNTGNYSVTVTNSAGGVISSNAMLTVIVPPVVSFQFLAGYPQLNLNGMLSSNFTVQYSTNLAGTNWINLRSVSNLSSSPYQFLDPAGIVPPARFYRALMQ